MKTKYFGFLRPSLLCFTLVCFLSPRIWAGPKNPIQFSGTPTAYSFGGTSISLYPNATVTLPSGEILEFSLSGKGLRQKWMAIIKVNAYVGIHYLDNPAVLNSQDPIGSLAKTQKRMMILQMLQNVSAEDIRAEFDDALDVNGVNLNSPEIASLREQTTYSLNAGERAYLIGYHVPNDSFEHLMVYTDKKSITERGSTLVTDVWRTWFGIPVDQEMAALKKSLLAGTGKP
jgi:hypothetical protein